MDGSLLVTILTSVGGTSLVGGIISIIANRSKDKATAGNTDASSAQILTNIAVEQVKQFQAQITAVHLEMAELKIHHKAEMAELNEKIDQLETTNDDLRARVVALTGRVDRAPTGPTPD